MQSIKPSGSICKVLIYFNTCLLEIAGGLKLFYDMEGKR